MPVVHHQTVRNYPHGFELSTVRHQGLKGGIFLGRREKRPFSRASIERVIQNAGKCLSAMTCHLHVRHRKEAAAADEGFTSGVRPRRGKARVDGTPGSKWGLTPEPRIPDPAASGSSSQAAAATFKRSLTPSSLAR